MKKLLYIGGGSALLLMAVMFGVFFAGPLSASASTPSTTPSAQSAAKQTTVKDDRAPLREFVRNHPEEIVEQIAPRLHLTKDQLVDRLRKGERLKDIAKDQGVSLASLRQIIINSIDTVVNQLRSAGRIGEDRAELIKKLVREHPFVVAHVLHRYYYGKN